MRGGTRSVVAGSGLEPGQAFARVAFAADRRPWQRSLRWERYRPGPRRLVVTALVAIVATLLELSGFDALMRERFDRTHEAVASAPFVVHFEDLLPAPPPEPEPVRRAHDSAVAGARAPARRERTEERPRRPRDALDVAPAVPVETPPLLVDRDGRALLPDGRVLVAPKDGAAMFRHDSPVPYAQTRFEQAFAPRDEDLGHELIRRTTVKHTWRTPWGSQITCSASMTLMFLGGCGWGLAPRATAEELRRMRADPPPSKPDKSALRLLGS